MPGIEQGNRVNGMCRWDMLILHIILLPSFSFTIVFIPFCVLDDGA